MTTEEFLSLTPVSTKHFTKMVEDKGFSQYGVLKVLRTPDDIYAATKPNQWHIVLGNTRIVGEVKGRQFLLITIYKDER